MEKGVLGMCNLLGHSDRRDGAGRRSFADVGGSAWRRIGVLGSRACYPAYKLAHKQQGGGTKFTNGAGWSGLQRSDVGGEVVRRRWAELRGRAVWWSSWLLDSLDRCRVILRRRWKGQRDRSITGGEKSGWRSLLPAASIG